MNQRTVVVIGKRPESLHREGLFETVDARIRFGSALAVSLGQPDALHGADLAVVLIGDSETDDLLLISRVITWIACPLLVITAHEDDDFMLKAYNLGVDECIGSNVSTVLCNEKIQAWLRWLGRRSSVAAELQEVGLAQSEPTSS